MALQHEWSTPRVVVIVVTWNSAPYIKLCLESVLQSDIPLSVLVVDNASADSTVADVATTFPAVKVIETGENLGYSGGNNAGIADALDAGFEYAFILNPDAIVAPSTVRELLAVADARPRVGAVSPVITYRETDTIWFGGGSINLRTGATFHRAEGQQLSAAQIDGSSDRFCGCAVLLRLSAVREVGAFDDRYFLYYEDVELSMRLRNSGYGIAMEAKARCWHAHSSSTGGGKSAIYQYYMTRNRLLFLNSYAPRSTASLLTLQSMLSVRNLLVVARNFGFRAVRTAVSAHASAYRDFLRGAFGMWSRRSDAPPRPPASTAGLEVHLVDVGGRGGVFQHCLAVAQILADHGARVTLHSASDAEDHGDVRVCGCIDWHRSTQSRTLRRVSLVSGLIFRTARHLRRLRSAGGVLHIHGASPLCVLLVVTTQNWSRRIYSPHNTFSRSRSALTALAIRWAARNVDEVVVYSEADSMVVRGWGRRAARMALVQYVPDVAPEIERAVAARLRDPLGRPVVMMAGQIRGDKRPDLFVRALAALPDVIGGLIGEDAGAANQTIELARQLGVTLYTYIDYVPLAAFVAAIRTADVVVAPYEVASQSGVLSLARLLGVPTVSSGVGGLAEVSDFVMATFDEQGLVEAIRRALSEGSRSPRSHEANTVVDLYLGDRQQEFPNREGTQG